MIIPNTEFKQIPTYIFRSSDHRRGVITPFKNPAHHRTRTMDRSDVFKTELSTGKMYQRLVTNKLAKFQCDNETIKKYVDAKIQGNYRQILYDCNSPRKTVYKNMVVLRKLSTLFEKPLIELTESDIYDLQSKLNNDEVTNDGNGRPILHPYKVELVKNFKQFWAFYRAYAKFELKKEIPNIVEFFDSEKLRIQVK
jgi:hypothetical protein